MNEDFGVGRRPQARTRPTAPTNTTTNTNLSPNQSSPQRASVDVSKYRPSTQQDYLQARLQPVPVALDNSGQEWQADFDSLSLGDNSPRDGSGGNEDFSGDNRSADSSNTPDGQPKRPWHQRFKAFLAGLSRKQWIVIVAVILVLTAGTAVGLAMLLKDEAPAETVSKAKPVPAAIPKPVSPLTGVEVAEAETKRPVIGVMVENSTAARPQSGLQQAGVVYEAIAEYGITRFLALYQEAAPENIGPVRSARPYFVDWARGYEAAYGHVGGSPDALAKIKTDGVRDLDQFANSGAYRRIGQREAPHNVYTTMGQLRELTTAKGWNSSSFTGLARKKEAKAAQVSAQAIDINISGPTYNVHYDYDPASNSYLRTMGGAPHTDADSGARIAPKVVVGIATQYGLLPDGYHSTYATTGSGTAKIFQDGTATEVTWTREGTGQYQFKDSTGKAIALNPGQTWITMVGDPTAISFSVPAPTTPAATPAP